MNFSLRSYAKLESYHTPQLSCSLFIVHLTISLPWTLSGSIGGQATELGLQWSSTHPSPSDLALSLPFGVAFSGEREVTRPRRERVFPAAPPSGLPMTEIIAGTIRFSFPTAP